MKKKFFKIVLTFLIALTSLFTLNNDKTVYAEDNLACGTDYEVSLVNDDGTFNKISCHSDFSSAKQAMQQAGNDAVVRHSASYSPTKIIAVASGVAISYPRRMSNSSGAYTTLTITSYIDGSGKSTYVTQHREMSGAITESYDGNGNGRVFVQLNGFSGYANLKQMDLVPMKFIEKGISIQLGGNDLSANNEQPFTLKVKQSHYKIEQNGNYKDLVYYAYSGYSSEEYRIVVGQAADWMKVGETYYSWNNYEFYRDRLYKDYVGTYYNYYQFLPVRSQSTITNEQFNTFLQSKGYTSKPSSTSFNDLKRNESQLYNEGQTFIDAQNSYGVNALLIFSMACLESGYGRSRYAIERNNLFGWNAFDSNPDSATTFSSISQAIIEHMGINLRGYTDIMDARFFGTHIGNKGSGFNVKYASDPYWGMKIAAIAYEIDKLAANNDGTLRDYNQEQLGLIKQFDASVKKEKDNSSKTLYTTKYGSGYQQNFTVIILDQDEDWTQIQTTNGIDANGNLITHRTNGAATGSNLNGLIFYDFNSSVGYLPTSQIVNLNFEENLPIEGTAPTSDFVYENQLELKGDILYFSGKAYYPGLYVTDENKVVQKLVVYNDTFEKEEYDVISKLEGKDVVSFEASLDLSSLDNGVYYFKLNTEYTLYNQYAYEAVIKETIASSVSDTKQYDFEVKEDILWLTISDIQKEEPVPTPTPDTNKEDQKLIHEISSFKRVENTIEMNGIAFISGMDAVDETDIQAEIYFLNLETNEKVILNTQLKCLDEPIASSDGYQYSKVNFIASISEEKFEAGNYALFIKIKNEDTIKEAEFRNYYNSIKPEDIEKNDYLYRYVINTAYNYRYELRIENAEIDYSLISTPTSIASNFDFYSIELEENQLKLNMFAWIYGTDINAKNNPVYQLLFVNEKGQVFEKQLNNQGCQLDFSGIYRLKFDTSYACVQQSVDLSDLASGKYILMLDMSVGKYRDIIELYDYYERLGLKSSYKKINYSLNASSIRNRLILEIK